MKSVLISGSIAYDYIMDFPDSFRHHIMPDQLHILNVAFVVDKLEKNLGGTAANIAYTMKLLGYAEPLILSCIGKDYKEYEAHWEEHGINTDYILQRLDTYTASAHITTDKDDNQITAFYAGALGQDDDLDVSNITQEIELAIIAPTKKETMLRHVKQCAEKHIPSCFDPGQQITAFTPQELMLAIGQATYLIGNDYEIKLIEQKTGWGSKELLDHVEVVITTLGAQGVRISTKEECINIPAAAVQSVEDPTGAGDAFRAGFFSALAAGHTYETCGRIGAVAASYAIEHYGTQVQWYSKNDMHQRYIASFGSSPSSDLL